MYLLSEDARLFQIVFKLSCTACGVLAAEELRQSVGRRGSRQKQTTVLAQLAFEGKKEAL